MLIGQAPAATRAAVLYLGSRDFFFSSTITAEQPYGATLSGTFNILIPNQSDSGQAPPTLTGNIQALFPFFVQAAAAPRVPIAQICCRYFFLTTTLTFAPPNVSFPGDGTYNLFGSKAPELLICQIHFHFGLVSMGKRSLAMTSSGLTYGSSQYRESCEFG